MAVTLNPITNPATNGNGTYHLSPVDVVLDNSYPTGGYTIAASALGFTSIYAILSTPAVAANNFLEAAWNPATGKLMVFYPTGGSAASPATVAQPAAAAPAVGSFTVTTTPDAGATTMTGSAAKPALVGVISGALAAPATTPGAGKEVANGTDLSAFTVRLVAVGA